jgi:hypothetical protein
MSVDPTGQFLYVVNAEDQDVVNFLIGANGALTLAGGEENNAPYPQSVATYQSP